MLPGFNVGLVTVVAHAEPKNAYAPFSWIGEDHGGGLVGLDAVVPADDKDQSATIEFLVFDPFSFGTQLFISIRREEFAERTGSGGVLLLEPILVLHDLEDD